MFKFISHRDIMSILILHERHTSQTDVSAEKKSSNSDQSNNDFSNTHDVSNIDTDELSTDSGNSVFYYNTLYLNAKCSLFLIIFIGKYDLIVNF